VQSHLLEQARVADPMLLARYATSLIDRLDQDGRYRELGHQQQRRELRMVSRPDGSCRLEGYCTAEAAEQLRLFVDAMAAPHPAVDGTPDRAVPGSGAPMRCWSWSSWPCAPDNSPTRAR